jgi:hypothetical protein
VPGNRVCSLTVYVPGRSMLVRVWIGRTECYGRNLYKAEATGHVYREVTYPVTGYVYTPASDSVKLFLVVQPGHISM